MPHWGQFRLRSIELDAAATVTPFEDTRPRWTIYGSSISEHPEARSPVHTWPAVVARACGLNLTCLGFAGECHLEPMVARMIRDLPADYITLSVGINIYGNASLNVRTYRPAIIGTVCTIRERHPDVPIAVVSPIFCPDAEVSPNAVGFDLQIIRAETAQAVQALQAHGDRAVHYVDGLDIISGDEADLRDQPHFIHPTSAGYEALAQNFLMRVMSAVFGLPGGST